MDLRKGKLELGLSGGGFLRWAAVDVTNLLEEARLRLDLSPIPAIALGRALAAAALLLRFTTKQEGRLVFEVLGDGPLRKVVAEADTEGRLRGLVGQPQMPNPDDMSLKIAPSIGKGTLRVTRESKTGRHSSEVALVTGEIGDDLTHYLEQSEQIHSAVLLGVLPRSTGIQAAGGLLVEALPGASEDTIGQLEDNIARLDGVSSQLREGGVGGLVDVVLRGFDRELLEEHGLAYECRCSRKGLLTQLGCLEREAIEGLVDENGRCQAVCAFCGTRYLYSLDELLSEQANA